MKTKYFYPAIFHRAEEGGYWVEFPDLDGCFTEGDTLEETVSMAKDAIGTYLSDLKEGAYPQPSDPATLEVNRRDAFIMVIDFDKLAWDKMYNSKSTKKTLTIPAWLNDAAIEKNINFSNVLQNALLRELHLA